MFDKSMGTNVVSVLLCGLGLLLPGIVGEVVLTTGLYAVSGAVTNWMAIYMLFEKVPLFYGSGVIPQRFTEFRAGIRTLVMEQFFTPANVQQVIGGEAAGTKLLEKVLPHVNFNTAFDSLVEVILQSSFGSMLGMFGGAKALQPLREPFVLRMHGFLRSVGEDPAVLAELGGNNASALLERVEQIVEQRLQQMTPELVKTIMQQMIQKHLGWLVVWGGVVGALMGLVVAVLPLFFQ
jgi:uncharacterized membrane protein YheB (UPF0754 family)